ncbi:hypothetical protein Vafri_776 [Volvox africanus]|nr:hypothetical protein Vafri_776 [Volvox africanus]
MPAELYVIEQTQTRAAAVQESTESLSETESMSITQSMTPLQASSRPLQDTPVTQSRAALRSVASQLGSTSSARTSPLGPYAVYDASDVVNAVYTTPDSRDGDCPLTASASSSFQGAWHDSCVAAVRPSPMSGLSVLLGAAPSSSTGSGYSPPSAGHDPGVGLKDEEMASEDISPYDFALLGSSSRPQSCMEGRAPLVVASLETEEALRALLATPRFARRRSSAAASIDVDGLEVPDDVLAALAKTDGMDLEIALGAAVAVGLREQAAHEQSGSPLERLAQQAQGHHVVMGPGPLTASPVAVPLEARGSDFSIRSVGAPSAGVSSFAGAASAAVPPHDAAHPQPQAKRSVAPVNASIEIDQLNELRKTVEVSVDARGLFAPGLRDSFVCAALMAGPVAPAQQPVLYSLLPKPGVPIDKSSRRNTSDGEVRRCVSTQDGGSRRNTIDGDSRRITADECTVLSGYQDIGPLPGSAQPHAQSHSAVPGPIELVQVSNPAWPERRPASVPPGAGTAAHERDMASSQPVARVCEGSVAVVSPFRAFRGSANLASPASSVSRHAGDGDLVLYGSPNKKLDVGASISVAASPYTPASPLPGPNTSPYVSSPAMPHVASRLQRSSRISDEAADPDSDGGQVGTKNGMSTTDVTGAGLQPRFGVSGAQSSSKRQLVQMGTSGMLSGTNNMHSDLSLTQAAAAAATCGSRQGGAGVQQPLTMGTLSPAISQRQLRTQGPQQLPVLQKHPPEQLQVLQPIEPSQLATCSTSSPAGLSSPPDSTPEAISHDLRVDEIGRPIGFFPVASDPTAVQPLREGLQVHNSNRTSRAKLQSLVPPLAAFSRAAALAAAADVGMAAPPPSAMWPGSHPTLVDTVTRVRPDSAATAHESGTGWLNAPTVVDTFDEVIMGDGVQLHGMGKRAGAISGQEETIADGRHAYQEHPELAQGQSPGHLYSALSTAKLSQLKARRQQQWQSQHGLQQNQPSSGAAATPLIQPRSGAYDEHLSVDAKYDNHSTMAAVSAAPRDHINLGCGLLGGAVTRPELINAPTVAVVPEVVTASPLAAAVSAPLLSDTVAESVNHAECGQKDTMVSGELNLGHGISGLSVAIESGQVKWAWQTDAKSQVGPGSLESTGKAPGGSPCASHAAARAAVRDSGTDWALQQLPLPQWKRHGQLPAVKPEEPRKPGATEITTLLSRQQCSQYGDSRRRSEYSFADRQTANTGPCTRQNNYAATAGGSVAQEQAQLRIPSATEGGGQPDSKAMALLRLKRQSIMRHNVQVSNCKEPGGQLEPSEHQTENSVQAAQRPQPSSAGYFGQLQLQQHHQPPQVSAAYALQAKQGDDQASKAGIPESENREVGSGDGATQQAQPKPFLRRRSAKVQARKVDWSYVRPRTNSRNPDYYGDQNSPDIVMKVHVSPLTSPRGGVAKPPMNANLSARGKKPSVKLPLALTQEERTPSGGPVKRRLSNIPPAPGLVPHIGATAEERMAPGVGPRRAVGGPLSPLDDLLAHVNTLLRDFDKIVL